MKGKIKKAATVPKSTPAKAKPTKATGGVAGILTAFGARDGTNRAKLLARLGRDIGRPVPVGALAEAVYGKADATGPLAMVMRGALATVAKKKPGYRIDKSGERGETVFTLSAVR